MLQCFQTHIFRTFLSLKILIFGFSFPICEGWRGAVEGRGPNSGTFVPSLGSYSVSSPIPALIFLFPRPDLQHYSPPSSVNSLQTQHAPTLLFQPWAPPSHLCQCPSILTHSPLHFHPWAPPSQLCHCPHSPDPSPLHFQPWLPATALPVPLNLNPWPPVIPALGSSH